MSRDALAPMVRMDLREIRVVLVQRVRRAIMVVPESPDLMDLVGRVERRVRRDVMVIVDPRDLVGLLGLLDPPARVIVRSVTMIANACQRMSALTMPLLLFNIRLNKLRRCVTSMLPPLRRRPILVF